MKTLAQKGPEKIIISGARMCFQYHRKNFAPSCIVYSIQESYIKDKSDSLDSVCFGYSHQADYNWRNIL